LAVGNMTVGKLGCASGGLRVIITIAQLGTADDYPESTVKTNSHLVNIVFHPLRCGPRTNLLNDVFLVLFEETKLRGKVTKTERNNVPSHEHFFLHHGIMKNALHHLHVLCLICQGHLSSFASE